MLVTLSGMESEGTDVVWNHLGIRLHQRVWELSRNSKTPRELTMHFLY